MGHSEPFFGQNIVTLAIEHPSQDKIDFTCVLKVFNV